MLQPSSCERILQGKQHAGKRANNSRRAFHPAKESLRQRASASYLSRMVQSVSEPKSAGDVSATRDLHIKAYRFMLLARVLDDKLASLYRAGKILGGVFLGRGQEALSVSIGVGLREGDIITKIGEHDIKDVYTIQLQRSKLC